MKKTVLILIILLALVFAVRLLIAFNTRIISSDGPFYISVARDFADGNYKQALTKQTFHPLYPFLIALVSNVIADWEWAGMLVSIILSCLATIPLYFIARRYFTGSIAIVACLLYAFHPQGAQLSASIFTTGTFIGVLLFALWTTIIALEKNSRLYFMLSGLLFFIMYLVRPDGVVFTGLTIIAVIINDRITNDSAKHTVLKIGALLIPWLLLIPNLLIVNALTGVFGLTGKVSADTFSEMGIAKSFDGLYQFIVDFIKGANPVLFILFMTGLILYFKRTKQAVFIWLAFAGFILVFSVYAFADGRMSKRYTVPLFLMMMPWTSAGLYYISERISKRHTNKILYGLTILLLLVLSVFTFKPVGKNKVIEKNTGESIKRYHIGLTGKKDSPVIITMIGRIAYYADGVSILPDGWDKDNRNMSDAMQSLNDAVRQKGADYLVLDSRITRKFPDLENEIADLGGNIKAELISQYFEGKPAGDSYKIYLFITLPH